jgi:hypothetical protein
MAGHRVVSHSGSIGDFTAHLILVPSMHLGITVLSNASAFVAAGHEGQYDVSLGLAKLLLGLTPTPHDRSWVTTLLLPCVLWTGFLLVAADAASLLFRRRRKPATARRRPKHLRAVLLSLTASALGLAILLFAPLASARYFYPDVGWGSTFLMWALFASAAIRALVLVMRPGASSAQTLVAEPETEDVARHPQSLSPRGNRRLLL